MFLQNVLQMMRKKLILFLLFVATSLPLSVDAQYCTTGLYSTACSSGDYIDKVVFGSINNVGSGCNGNPDNYIYYSSMSTSVLVGNSYTITLASGSSWSQHFGVWIDFNQDGDFDDAGEFVFYTTGSKPPAGSDVNGTITIPNTAVPGTTRMRVRCTYSSSGFTANQSCTQHTWGECEDYNIVIIPPSPNDLGVSDILTPTTSCTLTNAEDITVVITNYGTNPQSNFVVKYQINNNPPVSETVTATVAPSSSYTYVFSTKGDFSTPGPYTIKAWTELPTDVTYINDTSTIQIISIPSINTFPYVEDFTTTGGWVVEKASSSVTSSWQHGVPSGKTNITPISPGNACWITRLSGDYYNNDDSWIKSPCFDLTSLNNPVFKLDVWWDIENSWDGAVIQYSTDGGVTWVRLGEVNDPINWYNNDNITAQPGGQSQGWSGTQSNKGSKGWVVAQHDIPTNIGSAIFRIAFASDGSVKYDGIAVDNIVIGEKPNVNLGPDRFMCPGDTIYLTTSGNFSSYLWSDGSTGPSLAVTSPGIYWVKVVDANGLIAFDTVKVLSTPLSVNILQDTIYKCPDSAYIIVPKINPVDATVMWNTGATTPILTVTDTGKYVIYVSDTTGCVDKDSVYVTSYPVPSVDIPQDTIKFCAGESVSLNPIYDNSVVNAWWNNGVKTYTQIVTSPGTYIVYAANYYGCASTDTVELIMNYPPNVNLGEDVYVCDNTPVTLSPGVVGNNYSYNWSTGETTPTITVTSQGTYSVTVTDNTTGCSRSDTIVVVYAQGLDVELGDTLEGCGEVVLTAPSYSGVNYVWSTGETSQSITATSTGLYAVYLFNPFGCDGADSVYVIIRDALKANITTSLVDDTAEVGQQIQFIDATVPIPTNWFWNFGDGNTSTQQNPTHSYASTGTYVVYLIVEKPNFCPDTAMKIIEVVEPTSVEYQLFSNTFKVYPIPTYENIVITGQANAPISFATIEVKDLQGRTILVKQESLNSQDINLKLDINRLSAGTYILIANFDGKKVYRRIVKY